MSAPGSIEAARASFVEALKVKRYALATLASYGRGVGTLITFLAESDIIDVREITREHLHNFQLWLAEKPYTNWTRYACLQAVRRFFEHLDATDSILVNPCADMILPRIGKRLPRGVLTEEEARRVLDTPDTQTLTGLRNKTILEVFYSTGLRLAELARLTVFDVDHRNGFVRVNRGKGGKDRVVPLGNKACDYVREYLARARSEWSKKNRDERALWLSSVTPHGPLKAQAIEVMVKQCGRTAGVRVTPHTWRHTCATHLVANGANIAAVQRQLGHRSLRTTQIYTRVAVPDLQTMHRKAHPRSRARRTRKKAQ
jgi:integrase/recombinase XerD